MPFPDWRAGMKVTPARLTQMQTVILKPTATQTVNNSATFVNDATLTAALAANGKYIVEVHAVFTSASASSDLKTEWSVPAGSVGTRLCIGATNSATTFTSETDTKAQFVAYAFTGAPVSFYQMGTASAEFIQEYAFVTVGVTPGSVTFRWAQNTATAANTVRTVGSYMKIQQFA